MNFQEFCASLEAKITASYESGVTVEEAERLAGEFLHAQIRTSQELKVQDLGCRMRKSGVKAIKAAVYMEAATKTDKKPSDVMLNAIVDINELVQGEQRAFDEAEAAKDDLERFYNIFREAHIFFRGVSKGGSYV